MLEKTVWQAVYCCCIHNSFNSPTCTSPRHLPSPRQVNILIAAVSDSYKEIKRHEEQEMLRHYAGLIVQTARRRELIAHCRA